MGTREILTLQFGHYSNFVGSHFWNIQELSFDYTGTVKTECNHDILYREGRTANGQVTYTPRLLLADLKGSLNSLPSTGGLVDRVDEVDPLWDTVEKIEEAQSVKNSYLSDLDSDAPSTSKKEYHLEQEVNTWTDFLYPKLHSRTVNIVNEYQHGDHSKSFDIINTGHKLWNSKFGDTFSDNIRKYVEECDNIQGFQMNYDCTDGFAGLALGCLEHLVDEYSKSTLVYPIIASHFSDNKPTTQEERDVSNIKDSTRLINLAVSIKNLSEHASMFVPICTGERGWRKPGNPRLFECIDYNPECYYHSSAILASALDTLSQKYRHKESAYTLSDISKEMTGYGRKMAAASLGMPFAINESQYLIEYLDETTRPIYSLLTPSCKVDTDKIFQLITVRGIPESYLKAPLKDAKEQMNMPAYACRNVKEMFELYFQANNFLSATNVTVCEKPLELKTPFPRIFSPSLNKYGFVRKVNQPEKIESCPVVAGFHNGTFISDMLEKLHREVSRIKFARFHKFQEEGLESADYMESLNILSDFKDNYVDSWEL